MRRRTTARVAVAVAIVVMGVFVDQVVVGRMRGGGLRFATWRDWIVHLDAVMIALAAVGVWVVTEGRRPALVGLGCVATLLAVGLLWPYSLLGSAAAAFAIPLLVVVAIRVTVEFATS